MNSGVYRAVLHAHFQPNATKYLDVGKDRS